MDHLMGLATPDRHPNHSNPGTPTITRKQSTPADAIQGANQFGLSIFNLCIAADCIDGNVILSPKSFTNALEIVGFGSAGETKKQIEDALGGHALGLHYSVNQGSKSNGRKFKGFAEKAKAKILKKMPSIEGAVASSSPKECDSFSRSISLEDMPYTLVNKVCIKKGLNVDKNFTTRAKSFFGAKTESMDFQGHADKCREQINNWVSKHTEGKIKNMVGKEDITAATFMIIINAIYFKGEWDDKFDKMATHPKPFKTIAHGEVSTDFMFKKSDTLFCDYPALNCRAVELPYTGKDLSFVAILPNTDDGLPQLERNLNMDAFKHIFTNMSVVSDLLLYLPKFKIETSVELSSSFQKLGIVDLFREGVADLRGIESKGLLYVSGVAHKACIEINEEGCEAAAATADILRAAGGPEKEYTVFDADHPFLFLIKENSTNMILFMGKYCQPK